MLKDPTTWHLMMDWAQDKIGYPDFDNKIRDFEPWYIHDKWKPLINVMFVLSDPSNKDLQSPTALVKEVMQNHGVSSVTPADPLTNIEDHNLRDEGILSTSGVYISPITCIYYLMQILAGPLLKDLTMWCLMMDWTQDKIGYPDFDNKIRDFGQWYIHDEWKSLINVIFVLSDPSNEELQSPTALVEEAMQNHGVSFFTSANPSPMVSASQSKQRCAGKAPQKLKH